MALTGKFPPEGRRLTGRLIGSPPSYDENLRNWDFLDETVKQSYRDMWRRQEKQEKIERKGEIVYWLTIATAAMVAVIVSLLKLGYINPRALLFAMVVSVIPGFFLYEQYVYSYKRDAKTLQWILSVVGIGVLIFGMGALVLVFG